MMRPLIYKDWARLQTKFVVLPNGCWLWHGARNPNGYSSIGVGRHNTTSAHRLSFMFFRGSIPPELQVDHLCRNRLCVNPWHMELVTQRENLRRGNGISAQHARKTHCKHGHLLGEKDSLGRRTCKVCVRENNQARVYVNGRRYKNRAEMERAALEAAARKEQ